MDMTSCNVRVTAGENIQMLTCEKGSKLIDVLSQAGIHLDTPCGGMCLCGKCKVRISGSSLKPAEDRERIY